MKQSEQITETLKNVAKKKKNDVDLLKRENQQLKIEIMSWLQSGRNNLTFAKLFIKNFIYLI